MTADEASTATPSADPLHARQLELFELMGTHTAVVAPLRARRQVLGAISAGRGPAAPR